MLMHLPRKDGSFEAVDLDPYSLEALVQMWNRLGAGEATYEEWEAQLEGARAPGASAKSCGRARSRRSTLAIKSRTAYER